MGSAHGHYAYRIGELAEELKVDTFPRWFGEGAVVYTQDDANEIWFRYKSFLHSKVCTRPLAGHRAPQLRCHCPAGAPSASPRCGPPPLARPVLALWVHLTRVHPLVQYRHGGPFFDKVRRLGHSVIKRFPPARLVKSLVRAPAHPPARPKTGHNILFF